MVKKFLFILFICSISILSAPIQWSASAGGNNHWYDVVVYSSTWAQANAHVANLNYLGIQGHLVTITSAEENNFIQGNFSSYHAYFIGAYQTNKLAEPAGNWAWVTGEAWTYSNWATSEPNNSAGDEDCAQFYSAGTWNDIHNNSTMGGYLVEYDVPVPEISSLFLFAIGILGMNYFKKRN